MYIIPLWVYWRNRRRFDSYVVILSLYTITATLCALYYKEEPAKFKDLQLFPFIYMFAVLMVMFSPVKGFNINEYNLKLCDTRALKYLSYFFIVVSFIDIVQSIPHTIENIQSGEWGALRNQLDEGAEGIVYYSNQWERLVKNLSSYLSPFALVYSFYQITKDRVNKIYIILFFSAIVVPGFIAAAAEASRGMIMHLVIKLGFAYMIFNPFIPYNRKKVLYALSMFLLFGFCAYSMAVTISRFGEDDAGSSLFMYFGHSMLYFNDGVYNNMHEFAWGKRFFSWFIDLAGGDSYFNTAKAGGTFGSAFYTIVGSIYIDWGPIGTVIVAFCASLLMNKWFKKQYFSLADLIVIIFYLSTLANGIFVFGKGRALSWLSTFVIYYIVKKLEKKYI